MSEKLLSLEDLKVSFKIDGTFFPAVDGVSLDIMKNETFAIVGESGCGKSTIALSILQLHDTSFTKLEGAINYYGRTSTNPQTADNQGEDLLSFTPTQLNKIRGAEIGMIFQDPLTSLNPLHRIGRQLEEGMYYHTNFTAEQRKAKALKLMEDVGIPNPALTYDAFPHELSGGMRQRIVIAIALACEPAVIVADEPTTALDVTIQAQVLDLIRDLQRKYQSSVLLITHDLGVVAEMADKVAVMYAGQIVETASVDELFHNPLHPYTRSLFSSMPSNAIDGKLSTIQGSVPSLINLSKITGCRFAERIPWIGEHEHEADPILREVSPGHFVRCTCYKNFRFEEEA